MAVSQQGKSNVIHWILDLRHDHEDRNLGMYVELEATPTTGGATTAAARSIAAPVAKAAARRGWYVFKVVQTSTFANIWVCKGTKGSSKERVTSFSPQRDVS
jgi:hypothetical protein